MQLTCRFCTFFKKVVFTIKALLVCSYLVIYLFVHKIRLSISDGISCILTIVTDRAFANFEEEEWAKTFNDNCIISIPNNVLRV